MKLKGDFKDRPFSRGEPSAGPMGRTPLQLGPWPRWGNAAFVLLMVGREDFNVSEEQEIQKATTDFAWQSKQQPGVSAQSGPGGLGGGRS